MRWFLRLAYDGTSYNGWQSQPNATGVQSVIEKALSTMLRENVKITGAGRTDTGVHARCMYAHFDTSRPIESQEKFLSSLNRLVGRDIAVYELFEVKDDAHARFDAISRTYRYYVSGRKNPFSRGFSWECRRQLDVDAMNEAAALLLSVDDFTSFAKLHSDAKTNICNVTVAHWERVRLPRPEFGDEEMLVFTIKADRFLRNMVRAVVGTLVEVGLGKMTVDGFADVIRRKDRCSAGTSMPAQALFLEDIEYPVTIRK